MIDEFFEAVNSVFSSSRPESNEVVESPESSAGILFERDQGLFDAMQVGVNAVVAMFEEFPERTERFGTIATTSNSIVDPAIVQTAEVRQPETAAEASVETLAESEVEESVVGENVVSLDERRQLKEQQKMLADARAKAAKIHSKVA